jgi:hypothetical protein
MVQLSERFLKALKLASVKHKKQRRKGDSSPYVNHLLEVVNLLVDAGYDDENLLISALLHDSIEDTNITIKLLKDEFGKEVASTVMQLTDDKSLSLTQRRETQLKKALFASKNVRLIKLVDAISNASLLPPDWSLERAQSSLNHLKDLTEICSVESENLAKSLFQTIEITFANHGVLVDLIAQNVDVWLANDCVFYSFCSDKFYVFTNESEDQKSIDISRVSGKYDVYLRAIRPKKLLLNTERTEALMIDFVIDENGKRNLREPVFEDALHLVLKVGRGLNT